MALPIIAAQIGYGLIRSLLARYGSRKGVQTLMSQLGVDKKTATNILGTYNKVKNKSLPRKIQVKDPDTNKMVTKTVYDKVGGDVTLKLGGKQVTSNKNVINFETTKDQALILKNNPLAKAGGTGGKANLLGGNSLNPTAGSKMFPQGTGQGLLSTVRQGVRTGANATGRGLLNTAKFVGSPAGIGTGLLATGAYSAMPDPQAGLNQPGRDGYYDENGILRANDGSVIQGSYQDKLISGEIVPNITKQSYEEYKKQKQIFHNTGSISDRMFSGITGSEADPANKDMFKEEAALYRKEMNYGKAGNKNEFQIGYNALPDMNKIRSSKKPDFSLDDAKGAFATASSLSDKEPQNKYGERFTRIEGEDRNVLERTFGFGEQGVYQENMYDKKTGQYVPNPDGKIFTEDEIVNNKMQVDVKNRVDTNDIRPSDINFNSYNTGGSGYGNIEEDPNSNPDNIAFNAKGTGIGPVDSPTRTIQTGTSRSTTMTGPNGETISAGNRVGNNIPRTGDFANQMGLANFLYSQSGQGQGQFLGANSGFNTGFLNNQNPQQQIYGQRRAGLFDPEYYKQIMSFLN